ncbi:MAG TPA: molybdate ABC transporter substrate-binding protein [Polyangiales bacterium]|nr:molybdate ABC transporter substrate-binding protein [Polyangiales bacterium]
MLLASIAQRRGFSAAAFALLVLSGCADREVQSRGASERELVVFAAASLREAFDALGKELERSRPGVRVRISYAGSQVLRAQLEQGAAADLIAAAAPEELAPLVAQQRIAAPRVLAHNELVIAKPKGAPAPSELRGLGECRRIVIGTESVPVGRYARRMIERADAALGSGFAARVLSAVVSQEPNTRLVLAKVSLGEADAGIVYRTDALAAASTVDTVAIPPALNERAEYVIAEVNGRAHPGLAAAFIALATSAQGQALLQRFGFLAASQPASQPALDSVGRAGDATSARSGAAR